MFCVLCGRVRNFYFRNGPHAGKKYISRQGEVARTVCLRTDSVRQRLLQLRRRPEPGRGADGPLWSTAMAVDVSADVVGDVGDADVDQCAYQNSKTNNPASVGGSFFAQTRLIQPFLILHFVYLVVELLSRRL